MEYKPKTSILFQLTVVLAGTTCLAAIISGISYYLFAHSLMHRALQEQMNTVLHQSERYISTEYTERLNRDLALINKNISESLSQQGLLNEASVTKLTQNLLNTIYSNGTNIYLSVDIYNAAGRVIASASNTINSPRNNNNAKEYQITINKLLGSLQSSINQNTFFSPVFTSENQNQFFAATVIKHPESREILGIAAIAFSIDLLIEHLSSLSVLNQPAAWLYTQEGRILYKPEKDTQSPTAYIFNNANPDHDVLVTYSKVKNNRSLEGNLILALIVPDSLADKPLYESLFLIFSILIGIICIATLLAYITVKKIILPIHKLTALSQKVAAGDFNVRMQANKNNEIGTLISAFNMMVQELEEQRYELQMLANKDTLTQLPNRRQFEDQLANLIRNCKRNHVSIAVLYLDLDQFKDTNDSFGHPAGDKLIRDVSARLLKTVRQTDMVARLGGDEFAIILNPHKSSADTELVAKKILKELSKPFTIENQQIFSGASIGISIYPNHGSDATELVKNADAAMYKAKNMGRNSYQFYSSSLTEKANERIVLGALIRTAIEEDQFSLYYQPKIDLNTKDVNGAEALLRWSHRGQTILPFKIIDIAESSGFIEKIDAWVLHKACQQIQEWGRTGTPIIPISINISGRLLERDKIITILKQALHQYSIDPRWIEIEITENDLISNHKKTQEALKIIHSLGVKIAIDDFGTGYSSLAYLKDLLADTLKIDRKFVVNAMKNDSDQKIATAIVKLARSLNMHVVVEGIETVQQEELFKELGAHSAQGWLYAKAMPKGKFMDYLNLKRPKTIGEN